MTQNGTESDIPPWKKWQKMQNDMKYNIKWHNMAQIDIK